MVRIHRHALHSSFLGWLEVFRHKRQLVAGFVAVRAFLLQRQMLQAWHEHAEQSRQLKGRLFDMCSAHAIKSVRYIVWAWRENTLYKRYLRACLTKAAAVRAFRTLKRAFLGWQEELCREAKVQSLLAHNRHRRLFLVGLYTARS